MDPKGTSRAVKATALSREAWDVVLDAGRRRDASASVWAELDERGITKGRALTPLWRDVVAGLARPESRLEILARSGELRFRTTLSVLGTICLLETSRERVVDVGEAMREPRVLVQIADRGAVFEAVARVLPPVDELRADDPSFDEVSLHVPATDLPFDGEGVNLDERAMSPAGPPGVLGTAAAQEGWLSAEELTEGHPGDDLSLDEAEAQAFGALLAGLSDEPTADESADALASVPGVDPRLAALLREPETEVLVLRTGAQQRVRSTEAAMEMLGGLALRQWVVIPEGLVAVRADMGGLRVVGVEPGDLARQLRLLVAGELPDVDRMAEHFEEDA